MLFYDDKIERSIKEHYLYFEHKMEKSIEQFNEDDFVYVPSIGLYVSKEKTLCRKNWFNCHKELQSHGNRMPIIPEFREFLNYLLSSGKQKHSDIYKNIIENKLYSELEWLDADFKVKNNQLYINYNHILDSDGNLVPQNSEILDKNTLMEDKIPGISLKDWINSSHTEQGLPTKKVKKGSLYYWHPSDDNSVAGFSVGSGGTDFYCFKNPSSINPYHLGVRIVRSK
jgi:hypothetical protein